MKVVRFTWGAGVFSDADRLETITKSTSPSVRVQLNLRKATNDPDELLQAILRVFGEQKSLASLQAEF